MVDENSNSARPPEEHHLTTARTARYFTVGAPAEEVRTVWFALHGYAQLASRFLRGFEGVVPPDTLIVAPEGLSRFYLEMPRPDRGHMARVGAAWMTKEDRLADIADTRGWLDSVYREIIDRVVQHTNRMPAVGVLAFSQGVATSMRWVAGGVVKPDRMVAWAGSLADDVDALALQLALANAEVLLVSGTADQFLTAKARRTLLSQWEAFGIPVREVEYEGDHALDPHTLGELLKISRP